ncbi:hypothetical protein KAT63_02490 [Candidatus Parcubacteria bacterium]|nr:hypothetical protein [Candidatus Parcubacteria bacterium]
MAVEMSIPIEELGYPENGQKFDKVMDERRNMQVTIPENENVLSYREMTQYADRELLEALDFMVETVCSEEREIIALNIINAGQEHDPHCNYQIVMILKPIQKE